ncbi:MAG: hypothetical protein IIX12_01105, partial [Alistipes sp.]|nr:hypothetical protein [Alistipes sp.]
MVDADGVVLRNFKVITSKPELRVTDVRNLRLEQVQIEVDGGTLKTELSGEMNDNLVVKDCNFTL